MIHSVRDGVIAAVRGISVLLSAVALTVPTASAAQRPVALPRIREPASFAAFVTASDNSIYRMDVPGAHLTDGRLTVSSIRLAKYSKSGKAVTSFGTHAMSERVVIGRDAEYWRFRPVTLPNNRTAVFGTLSDDPVTLDRGYSLAVFNARGRLDRRFAGDGVFVKRYRYADKGPFLANSAAAMANGSVAVCGNELMPDRTTSVVIKSYGINGRLDPTFGNGGVFRFPHEDGFVDRCERVISLPELTMVVRSYRRGAGERSVLRVVRLTQSGGYDAAFGAAGVAEMPEIRRYGTRQSLQTYAITKDGQGRMLIAFHGDVRHESYVARLTSQGSLDATFSSGGYSIVPFSVYSIVQPVEDVLLLTGDRVVRSKWGDPAAMAIPCYGKLSDEGVLDRSGSSNGFKSLSRYDGTLSDPFKLSGRWYYWGVRPVPKKRSDLFAFPGPLSRPIEIR